jgi:S1-C subfamily serine protease
MRLRRHLALMVMALAAFIARNPDPWAQSGVASAGAGADQSESGAAQAQGPSSNAPAANSSDQTLEIAPRIVAPPPVPPESEPDSGATSSSDAGQTADQQPPPANTNHPYLGISVQTIYSDDRPGSLVSGLEVVSVDNNSPAEIAGLRGRTKMTSAGESGATVGALVPPLDLIVMPLLKKAGSLGQGGDLIIAIDDRRVATDDDLQSELESLKPGDVIYLTILRTAADGSKQTMKLPIKLGDASKVADTDDPGNASASSAVTPPK